MSPEKNFRAPRGTADILPEDQPLWSHVFRVVNRVAREFGYSRIDTPLFEATDLFKRGVGSETDIVQKEMYSFEDHGGDGLTLRPEGTAAVCRAYIEHGMASRPQPVRLFYAAPMFRYERPQAGRYRQFHQFGIEAIGDPSPAVDAEVIEMGWRFIAELGLHDVTLRLNSIGDPSDRVAYNQALRDYYSAHLDDLPKVDRDRLDRAPLRVLDSKEPESQALADGAPKSIDYLGNEASSHFEQLISLLEGLKSVHPDFSYRLDHRLVRGLDYYNRTVFEFEPVEARGQSTLLAGGRYDPLMEIVGGPATPAIGFAAGLERLIQECRKYEVPVSPPDSPDAVVIALGETALGPAATLAAGLRARGASVILAPQRSMKAQMRYAHHAGARYALILGDKEIERGVVGVKPMRGDGQFEASLTDVAALHKAISKAERG